MKKNNFFKRFFKTVSENVGYFIASVFLAFFVFMVLTA